MIKVDYLHIAEDVRIDEKGRNSIIGIAGRLDVPKVPAGLGGVKITAGLRAVGKPVVNELLKMKLVLHGPGIETVLVEIEQRMTIEVGYSFAPIFDFDTIVFPKFGHYFLELYVNGEKKADTSLMVKNSQELIEI